MCDFLLFRESLLSKCTVGWFCVCLLFAGVVCGLCSRRFVWVWCNTVNYVFFLLLVFLWVFGVFGFALVFCGVLIGFVLLCCFVLVCVVLSVLFVVLGFVISGVWTFACVVFVCVFDCWHVDIVADCDLYDSCVLA